MTADAAHGTSMSNAAPAHSDLQKPEFRMDPSTNEFVLVEDPRFSKDSTDVDEGIRDGKRTGRERVRDVLDAVMDGVVDFLVTR